MIRKRFFPRVIAWFRLVFAKIRRLVDELISWIPLRDIELPTSLHSTHVYERVAFGTRPGYVRLMHGRYYTFEGGYNGSFIKIRSRLHEPSGKQTFSNAISFLFFYIGIPIQISSCPALYCRVTDDEHGSVIKGHFGLPYTMVMMIIACALACLMIYFPKSKDSLLLMVLFALIDSINSLNQYIIERTAVIDFLKGLFYDVIRTEK